VVDDTTMPSPSWRGAIEDRECRSCAVLRDGLTGSARTDLSAPPSN
jgi:hypothetical protein